MPRLEDPRWPPLVDLQPVHDHRTTLIATYVALAADSRVVVQDHVEHLVGQLRRIIADGVERNELDVSDPDIAARSVFDATTRFHNPVHAAQWTDPAIDTSFDSVWELVLRGLGGSTRDRGRRRS